MHKVLFILFIISLFFIPACLYVIIISIFLGIISEKYANIKNIARDKLLDDIDEIENHKNKIL